MTLDEAEAQAELDQRFFREAVWRHCFSMLPRRCYLSGRWLWGSRHFRLSMTTFGSIGSTFETVHWLHRDEGMLIKLSFQN